MPIDTGVAPVAIVAVLKGDKLPSLPNEYIDTVLLFVLTTYAFVPVELIAI